jgi:hypothetical protein
LGTLSAYASGPLSALGTLRAYASCALETLRALDSDGLQKSVIQKHFVNYVRNIRTGAG